MAERRGGVGNSGDKKKSLSTNTMIEIGLGAGLLIEAGLLAFLFKKVNDLSAKMDPSSNDNKYIAQYVHLLETTVGGRFKQQDDKLAVLETELKKVQPQGDTTAKIIALENDIKQLKLHVNKLTESHNKLAAQSERLVDSKQPIRRGRQQYDDFSQDSGYSSGDRSPSPVKQPVRRVESVPKQPQRRPTATQPQRKASTPTSQNTASQPQKKKVMTQQSQKQKRSRPEDEQDSDIDYRDD